MTVVCGLTCIFARTVMLIIQMFDTIYTRCVCLAPLNQLMSLLNQLQFVFTNIITTNSTILKTVLVFVIPIT